MQLDLLGPPGVQNPNKMDYSDARMLGWLSERSGPRGRRMIDSILNRRIFQRIRVISSQQSPQLHQLIADIFAVQPESVVDKFTEGFQDALKREVIRRWGDRSAVPASWSQMLEQEEDLILIDAPWYRGGGEKELRYLREKSAGTYEIEKSVLWRDLHKDFNENVSKVRVFAHWRWDERISNTLDPEDIDRLLRETHEDLSRKGFVKKR